MITVKRGKLIVKDVVIIANEFPIIQIDMGGKFELTDNVLIAGGINNPTRLHRFLMYLRLLPRSIKTVGATRIEGDMIQLKEDKVKRAIKETI